MTSDRVEFSPVAIAELRELVTYIAQYDPDAAERVRANILAAVAQLALPAPRLDGPAALLNAGVPCRQRFVHPVTLYYDRAPGLVSVLHVWHHAREPIAR